MAKPRKPSPPPKARGLFKRAVGSHYCGCGREVAAGVRSCAKCAHAGGAYASTPKGKAAAQAAAPQTCGYRFPSGLYCTKTKRGGVCPSPDH